MSTHKKLSDFSMEELVRELRARTVVTRKGATITQPHESLRMFSSKEIYGALKSIWGEDDRQEIYKITNQSMLRNADSVVALFQAGALEDLGNGYSSLKEKISLGERYNLCEGEPFRNQPVGAFASGFLVNPDIIATAGHCIDEGSLRTIRFVFNFQYRRATGDPIIIKNSDIYRGEAIIAREDDGYAKDYALIRLIPRPAPNKHAVIRRRGKIANNQKIYLIGHPCGLPKKIAASAWVTSNDELFCFKGNLDAFKGNSGSPVFNLDSHEVEGILAKGELFEEDFVEVDGCWRSARYSSSVGRGERCTRATFFEKDVP